MIRTLLILILFVSCKVGLKNSPKCVETIISDYNEKEKKFESFAQMGSLNLKVDITQFESNGETFKISGQLKDEFLSSFTSTRIMECKLENSNLIFIRELGATSEKGKFELIGLRLINGNVLCFYFPSYLPLSIDPNCLNSKQFMTSE